MRATVCFQIGTGSQCDILSTKIYKRVTGVTPQGVQSEKEIMPYTDECREESGKATLPVWYRGQKSNFNVIDGDYQLIPYT